MRFLLSLMAIAMFAVSVGCDAPAEKPAETSKTPAANSGTDIAASSATSDTEGTQKVSLKLPGMT